MGLADIWRSLDNNTNLEGKDDKETRAKKFTEAAKQFETNFWARPGHQDKRNLFKTTRKFYEGDQYPDVEHNTKPPAQTDKEEKAPYIDPVANYLALHAEKNIRLLTASESPVVAQPMPDALSDKEVDPKEDLSDVNNLLAAARYTLRWPQHRYRACKMMVLYGTGYVNTLWDGNKGKQSKITKKDEVSGEEKVEMVADGDVEFETIHPSQVALDEECTEFAKSRSIVIKRKKTREQLLTSYKGADSYEELKTQLLDKATKQSQGSATSKTGTDEIDFYEVLIEPDSRSEFEPEGTHVWLIDNLIIHEEKPDWTPGNRPIVQYIMEEDEFSPLGCTRLTQLIGLQMSENQFLNLILEAGKNEVALQKIVNPKYVDIDDLGNYPQAFVSIKPEVAAQEPVNLGNVAANFPNSTSALQGLILGRNTIAQIREQTGVWYDPKYGYTSGQRRVGELQMLAEEYRSAYAQAIYNAWASDSKVWAAYYEKMEANLKNPRAMTYLDEQGKKKSFELKRDPVFERKGTPRKLDFVVASKNLPEPISIKLEKLEKWYGLGLFGQVGSPQAIVTMRRILKHYDELPEDPRGERYKETVKVLTGWLESIGTNPALLATKPLVSPFWDHAAMYEELENWFSANTVGMSAEQLKGYVYIMGKMEDAAQVRQLETQVKALKGQQLLNAMLGLTPGQQMTAGTGAQPNAGTEVLPGSLQ